MDHVLAKSDTRFSISNDGFSRMNAGRPCHELVREAVSNAFDATGVTEVRVVLSEGFASIEDNAPSGVPDYNLVTTVFMTEKNESCKKRGRKGRGLKELISAAEFASLDTNGFKVEFDSGHTVLTSDRKVGSKVCVHVSSWKADDINLAIAHLSKVISPDGVKFFINDVEVMQPPVEFKFNAHLETQVINNGVQTDTYEFSDVTLHKANGDGWVYEMGIPVELSNCPWHINVHQRIPLSDTRNNVSYYYMSHIYGQIISNLVDKIDKKHLDAQWVGRGLDVVYDDSVHAKYVKKMFGSDGHNLAIKSDNNAANNIAKSFGYKLIDTSSLPSSVVNSIKKSVPTSQAVAKYVDDHDISTVDPKVADPTGQVGRLTQYLGNKILKTNLIVAFFNKGPGFDGKIVPAKINKDEKRIEFNMAAGLNLVTPLNNRFISSLCAQFAKYVNTDTELLTYDTSEIAGQIAVALIEDRDKINALLTHSTAKASTRKAIIKCVDCGTNREVDEWNKSQVVRCVSCAKKARARRRNER